MKQICTFLLCLLLSAFTLNAQTPEFPASWPSKCNTNATMRLNVYLGNADGSSCLMEDYLRTMSSFPLFDPYSNPNLPDANHSFPSAFIHQNAPVQNIPVSLIMLEQEHIVDWIFVELRDNADPTTCPNYTRALLLKNDGQVVDLDGNPNLRFFCTPKGGNYWITIRHRNHLAMSSADALPFPGRYDFTIGSSTQAGYIPLLDDSNMQVPACPGYRKMVGGDANFDGSVDAFDTILWEQQNGLFGDYANNAEYTLDGSVDVFDAITWAQNNGRFANTTDPTACSNTFTGNNQERSGNSSESTRQLRPESMALWPNPADGIVHADVNTAKGGDFQLTISDMLGKVVSSRTVNLVAGNNNSTIDISGLQAGVYSIALQNGSSSFVVKLVKE